MSGRYRGRATGALLAGLLAAGLPWTTLAAAAAEDGPHARQALFGDLHVHTINSFDAYGFGVRATPDDAYRYAKGEAIAHMLGYEVQLRSGSLDFYGVTDHAVYLGAMRAMHDPEDPLHAHPLARELIDNSNPVSPNIEGPSFVAAIVNGRRVAGFDAAEAMRSAWRRTVDAAERHNDPGTFTTFIGYEYTSSPQGQTLHRNVIFAGSEVSAFPFTTVDSQNPENLWRWMDDLRDAGIDVLAIPHNSNLSSGRTFERVDWAGRPIDAEYAARRVRNEPLAEVTQVKGTSETHPVLSPEDAWAGFEIAAPRGPEHAAATAPGSYARDALRAGLSLEATAGVNPYRLGLIGSSDGHNASSPVDEDRYFGKLGRYDGAAGKRGSVPADPEEAEVVGRNFLEWSAAGLAGVWAEENTRASIFGALRRRETFATSGPRIPVRFFAGYGYGDALADDPDAVRRAYAGGVPMGGELEAATGRTPEFFVWAAPGP